MYFHLAREIYLTYYNDEIVVLDLIKDRYLVLQKDIADLLQLSLSHEFTQTENQFIPVRTMKQDIPNDFHEMISQLREMRILDHQTFDTPFPHIPQKKDFSAGMDNIDWRMNYGDLYVKSSKKMIMSAWHKRAYVEWLIRVRGFYHLINAIKKAGKKQTSYTIPSPEQMHELVTALNHACFYFPYKSKCLEWAATLALMALEKGWQCNLVIGIQNIPFMAHAWVEAHGKVIADTPDLPHNLSTILIEPLNTKDHA